MQEHQEQDVQPHTPGTLTMSERGFTLRADGAMVLMATFNRPMAEAEANARRALACWNALDGVPTADLERMKPGELADLFAELKATAEVAIAATLLAGREMHAACEAIVAASSGTFSSQRAVEMARAALAKARAVTKESR